MSSSRRRAPRLGASSAAAAAWNTMYDKLVQFHRTHGHCRIPKRTQKHFKLYRWASRQRGNASRLSEQQRTRLDAVGYDWTSQDQNRQSRWNEMFGRLEAYKNKYDNCLVSAGYEDQQLVWWVKQQRYHYLREEMPDERVRRLESLGFDWKPVASRVGDEGGGRQRGSPPAATPAVGQTSWDVMYEKLARHYKTNGNYYVYKSRGADLHDWIVEQRVANANNELSADKRLKLDQIHFAWMGKDEKDEELWNEMFESLKAYKAANGDCLVPRSYCEDRKLYNWVIQQRKVNKNGKLPRHRRDRLEGIGFCWDTAKASDDTSQSQQRDPAPAQARVIDPVARAVGQTSWDVMYEKLARHYKTNGNYYVYKSRGADLHDWIVEQRVANANNELSADKRLKLDQIHFAWMTQDEKNEELWNEMFESLNAYKAAKGNCLVPKLYREDMKLYSWVRKQLSRNKIGELPWHRRDRLQGIGFCWEVSPKPKGAKQAPATSLTLPETQPNPSAGDPTRVSNGQQPVQRWNLQLERLKIYQAWYGDCLVPTSYDQELAEWVSLQHNLHKLNKLREPRYGKLERIGFFSDAEAEKSLNGGTKRGTSPGAPLESEDQSFAGAHDLPDKTNNVGTANPESGAELSRSPKRARIDGFRPPTARADND